MTSPNAAGPLPDPVSVREMRVLGIRTVVREVGPADSEEAVVFVHGMPGSAADWDLLLPVVSLHIRDAWIAHGVAQVWSVVFIIMGWILATAVVLSLTGLLKRD